MNEIETLKSHIFLRYGKDVMYYYECEMLSLHIQECTKEFISPQTLRRFLGFIKTNSQPSKRTLQIISNYCGFDNIFTIEEVNSAFSYSKNKVLIAFIKEFYNIDINPINDINYQKACGNIAKKLVHDSQLLTGLNNYLSKNTTAQVYFFERFPYIDGLRSSYLKSFKKYVQQKQTNESIIFSQSLLFFSAFLGEDEKSIFVHVSLINKVNNEKIHPFSLARKFMTNILYLKLKDRKVELEHWKVRAFELEKKMPRKNSQGALFPYFQFILIECFNLINDHQSALKMLDIVDIDFKIIDNNNIEKGYYECLDVSKAFANMLAGNLDISRRLLNKIEPHNFPFISQKYYMLYYKITELKICKRKSSLKHKNIENEIDLLISQTDFIYFNRFL